MGGKGLGSSVLVGAGASEGAFVADSVVVTWVGAGGSVVVAGPHAAIRNEKAVSRLRVKKRPRLGFFKCEFMGFLLID
jgi:hypothetical protein